MNKYIRPKSVVLVMLCLALLLCGFTSNKGDVSGVETVNVNYTTTKLPKGEVLLTIYESKGNTKYNGFVTSDGTSPQIKVKFSAEPFKNITIKGLECYYCYALVNITPECKEKLEKGQLRVVLDPKESQKSETTNKKNIGKISSAIIIGIISAFVLSKITTEGKKED